VSDCRGVPAPSSEAARSPCHACRHLLIVFPPAGFRRFAVQGFARFAASSASLLWFRQQLPYATRRPWPTCPACATCP